MRNGLERQLLVCPIIPTQGIQAYLQGFSLEHTDVSPNMMWVDSFSSQKCAATEKATELGKYE